MEVANKCENNEEIMYKPSSMSIHNFQHTVGQSLVKFQILNMNGSTLVWIGDAEHTFSDLSFAFFSQFNNRPESISTKVMGDKLNLTSSTLSAKLSKKLQKPVYVSYNLEDDKTVTAGVTKLLVDFITKPQHFSS